VLEEDRKVGVDDLTQNDLHTSKEISHGSVTWQSR
jgi:hypothetical protein